MASRAVCFLLAAASAAGLTSVPAGTKLRVCSGSSCAGRCVGSFEPVRAFEAQADMFDLDIEVETVFCMNMCKRGPNVRLIQDGQVATVAAEMGETEQSRRAFQGVRDDARVWKIWMLAAGAAAGTLGDGLALHGAPPDDMV
ncbi:hypothetical protein T492DRAFT_1090737 [Pavlovales sp. CCMP2436]|nr:hypothetical protein T492DRAFT_1090737 [Pavlovales sp. CCMP2436]|mmetsp:Transcript_3931/g.9984  ORF Transcript_3931/g.9984 Transcript_3931/m.9984 type:complete len:142 (+) Transcript_3931:18-443(+)|eukprot:CAMPEP_0179894942 /NCGR_PEP_ID=MMETSP0982-20121206/35555_1 /TAXON_ID=483367 /ORGANISM="non described non described, Strain CCMP 2436" /LENGTH=141 /DNA_ID=CAMNT_0021791567 /DNA_START=85 /DNA_END=510 /DNA_ORIENTATION=-